MAQDDLPALEQNGDDTVKDATPDISDHDPPPDDVDGGYAWVIVASLFATMAVSWGVNSTYGVYTSFFLDNDYIPGGTHLRYGFVGGLSIATAFLSAPLANIVLVRFGARVVFGYGTAGVVLGQALAGLGRSFAVYLVCQGIVFGLGLGAVLMASQPLLSQWFDRRLGLAQGLVHAGSGLGGLVFANTTRVLLERVSFQKTLIVNAAISAAVMVPCVFLVRHGPVDAGVCMHRPSVHWLVHPGFVWVLLWGFASIMAYCIGMYTTAAYASDGLGLPQSQAAALQSLFAAGFLVGRPAAGLLLDMGGRIRVAILLNLVAGVSCLALWLPARSFAILAVFALVQGATGGSVWIAASPVATDLLGTHRASAALAVFWLVVAPAAAFSSPSAIALLAYSRDHLYREGPTAYAISIGFSGGLFFLSSACLYGAKVYHGR